MGSNSGPGGPRSFREKLNFYRFASRWVVPGSSRPVFDLLTELSGYPLWWPEVKQVGVIDEKCARVKIRATLPYSLEFVMRQEVVDKQAGLLQASLEGDLRGITSWRVSGSDGRVTLDFFEEVEVCKRSLRVFSPIARPLFIANHVLMMRHGEQGLRRLLANQCAAG